jgi:hypothetical protein
MPSGPWIRFNATKNRPPTARRAISGPESEHSGNEKVGTYFHFFPQKSHFLGEYFHFFPPENHFLGAYFDFFPQKNHFLGAYFDFFP